MLAENPCERDESSGRGHAFSRAIIASLLELTFQDRRKHLSRLFFTLFLTVWEQL